MLIPERVNVSLPDLVNEPLPVITLFMTLDAALEISRLFVDRLKDLVAPETLTELPISFMFELGVPTNNVLAVDVVVTVSIDNEPPTPKPPVLSKEPAIKTNL